MLGSVMHDSDSGIGIDSGMIPFFAGIGIGIGTKNIKIEESESVISALESESESRICYLSISLLSNVSCK